MTNAAYFRNWRKANPEYRRREAERSRRRRLAGARGDRSNEYVRQRERRAEQRTVRNADNGSTLTSHPILEAARSLAAKRVKPDCRSSTYRPTYEDAVGEAALAIVAGADPSEAVDGYLSDEQQWAHHTAPLLVPLLRDA